MTVSELLCHVRCPVCGEEITLDASLRLGMKRMVLGIDLAPVHAHISERHPDPATGSLHQAQQVEGDFSMTRATSARSPNS